MNVTFFTGAGISAESGINTFRDIKDGLWYNYNVDEVATLEGWVRNREVVLEFHEMLRDKIKNKEPNDGHRFIAELEKKHNVTVITQNVDELHEKAGSTKVYHLHGELDKSRSTYNDDILPLINGTIKIGDRCPQGSQLRPHTVLFGEEPYNIVESMEVLMETDVLVIIGTSFDISYVPELIKNSINEGCVIYYIDPQPSNAVVLALPQVRIIGERASVGVKRLKL